jgi:phage replication initiation protein
MTRPARNALVLDGDQIKHRLMAERFATQTPVHVDWLRFTIQRRFVPTPSVENLFPIRTDNVWDEKTRAQRLAQLIAQTEDCDTTAATQAYELAQQVCEHLGPDFTVLSEALKGHDFYRFRWSIQREGTECGWVGYQASSKNARQQAQNNTIHCNLYGAACTFATPGWNTRLADLIDQHEGDITRADLALDFFDGIPGGFESVVNDYKSGACDHYGKRLKCNMVGDWVNGHERSFYLGSKESGKQSNAYEKGDQLYGVEAGSLWHRVELRYGNKLRVLPSDLLRRPADFFAGASDWHASLLLKADQIPQPERVKCNARLQAQTVEAEVTRNLRWAINVAAPTIAAAWTHLGDDFLKLVTGQKLPGRLQRFKATELAAAFGRATTRFTTAGEVAPLHAMAA